MTVLTTTGVQSEAHLPFAGLHQLLRPVRERAVELPRIQRDALDTAFGLTDEFAPEHYRIAMASLDLISDVASDSPLLLVVEDAPWHGTRLGSGERVEGAGADDRDDAREVGIRGGGELRPLLGRVDGPRPGRGTLCGAPEPHALLANTLLGDMDLVQRASQSGGRAANRGEGDKAAEQLHFTRLRSCDCEGSLPDEAARHGGIDAGRVPRVSDPLYRVVGRIGGAQRQDEREQVHMLARHPEDAHHHPVARPIEHSEGHPCVGEKSALGADPSRTHAAGGRRHGVHVSTIGRTAPRRITRFE
jgi:hypothetical protein